MIARDGCPVHEPQERAEHYHHPAPKLHGRRKIAKMYLFRRIVAVTHDRWLELLLAIAIFALILQLAWPTVVYWWHLPSPGTVGKDNFHASTLAAQHLVYLPEGYVGSYDWPLVVFLHGSGERGTDPQRLRNIGPLSLKLPAIVAVPQCVPDSSWQPTDVAALVDHLATRYHVERRRVYLVGYSMGGFGVVATAAACPEKFAAIVPIVGGRGAADTTQLSQVPLWAFHGAQDKAVPLQESERLVQQILQAGGQAKLTILPDAGHGICDEVCRRDDLWQWLFAQRRTD